MPHKPHHFRPLLWLVALAFFMQALDSTIVNTALPAMARCACSRWSLPTC